MRGARRALVALGIFLSACASAPPPAPEPAAPAPAPEPVARFEPDPPKDPGVVPSAFIAPPPPPRPEPSFAEVLRLQRELASRPKAGPEEKLRLALLLATSGELEEAEKIVAGLPPAAGRLLPYLELFLRRHLGDHREASKVLSRLNDEDRAAAGFGIERADLVQKVRRFRDFDPVESDRVKPGGTVTVYVEPRNFTLKVQGDRPILHLRYEWKLFDENDAEVAVPAWENAPLADREDRLALSGPVSEFSQHFRLPLPEKLPAGAYRVRVAVTDVPSGKSDRVYLPITVAAAEGK